MQKVGFTDRARYTFDNILSRGTIALIALLAFASGIAIAIGGAVIAIFGIGPEGEEPLGFVEGMWAGLMRTLDAGTMGGDAGWSFRAVALIITLAGIFIISSLIGVLTSGLEERLEELRKGRSMVVESGHTVILGWSEQIYAIIGELVTANESKKDACIVVLADRDKVEMDDEIRSKIEDSKTTRIVTRSGSTIEMADLAIARIDAARSIVVLGTDKDDPDSSVIKTLLAILNNPDRKPDPYHIVAELREPRNFDVAKMVGKDEVEVVLVGDLISRIMAQTCRQSGLSIVYTELLDFGGDEMYLAEEPALHGKTFGESLFAYDHCTVMGLHQTGKAPQLNPPMDTRIAPGDKLIVVAEDDSVIKLSGGAPAPIEDGVISLTPLPPPHPERTLMLGWNHRAPKVIRELDAYVAKGSTVAVVADSEGVEAEIEELKPDLKNQQVAFRRGDTTDRRVLDALNAPAFNHVLLLCYADDVDAQRADAKTLITLLHLRDISDKAGKRVPIVSEMLDIRNRALAEGTQADDFIVSDKLVSLMLAQISETKELNQVFADLFDPDGSEVYVKPSTAYIKAGATTTFATIVEAARRKNEVAIGYRLKAHATDGSKAYGVVVNPKKSSRVTLNAGDNLIVVAES